MRALVKAAIAILSTVALGALPVQAATPPPEGFTYAPASERVMMGIGCTGTGVCDSTQYWIGKNAGDSSVGTIPGPVTPANEVAYQARGEALSNTDFPADNGMVSREFRVRTDEPLTGQVTIGGYQGVGSGVNTTVDLIISGRNRTSGKSFTLTATSTGNQVPQEDLVLEYSIDLDPSWDGDMISFSNVNLVVRGVNLLNGFVDGEGGSFFEVPTHLLVAVQTP